MVPFSDDSDDVSGGVGVASLSSSSTAAVAGARLLAALLLQTGSSRIGAAGTMASVLSAGEAVSSRSGSGGAELDAIVSSSITTGRSQLRRSLRLRIDVSRLGWTGGDKELRRHQHGHSQGLRMGQTGRSRSQPTSISFCSSFQIT